MPHVTDVEEWELYCLNRLSGTRRDSIDAHLLWCPKCQDAYEEHLEAINLIVYCLRRTIGKP